MPIEADALARRIAESGPFMFHVTSGVAAETMLEEGIRPRAAGAEPSEKRPFFESRAGHVYLLTVKDAPLVAVCGEWTLLQVDLRTLEPERFDTDEDLARNADQSGKPWVTVPTPIREMANEGNTEAEGQGGRLARWADETPGFDDSAVVEKSLAGGRVAYGGAIPAEALEVAHIPSEGGERFIVTACEVLGVVRSDLGEPPEIGHQDTEVERAYRLAEALLEAAYRRSPSENLREPYGSRKLGDALRKEGRRLNRTGDWRRGTVVLASAALAEKCEELDSLPSWPSNRIAFVDICDAAGQLLGVIRDCLDREAAVEAARRGMLALHDA